MSQIRVQLQQFEGPLDLLLYLIRKEEMDIFNINIVDITKQYFDYIKLMKEFDIEVAGDFIAMASTLIHIKSKMLLPQYDENGEVVENEDPRKELVQKLLEYEKFKEAAKALYERPLLNRDTWARGMKEKLEPTDDDIELEENALFSLIGSYRKVSKALLKKVHKVNVKLQSISSRIMEICGLLIPGSSIRMSDLLDNNNGAPNLANENRDPENESTNSTSDDSNSPIQKARKALITFLSLLELGKLGFVSLYQTEVYGDIHIQTKKEIDGDVLSKVEEYGNLDAEQVSHQLFKTAEEDLLAEQKQANEIVDNQLAFEPSIPLQTEFSELNGIADIAEFTQSLESELLESEMLDAQPMETQLLESQSLETQSVDSQSTEIASDDEILQAELEDTPKIEITILETPITDNMDNMDNYEATSEDPIAQDQTLLVQDQVQLAQEQNQVILEQAFTVAETEQLAEHKTESHLEELNNVVNINSDISEELV